MPMHRLNTIGYCSRMTEVGDWAFEFALDLARRHDAQLDIFYHPTSPCREYESHGMSDDLPEVTDQVETDIDHKVRLYYDDRLGGFMDAGFRVCLDAGAPKTNGCQFGDEFDLLVIGYERHPCPMGERPINQFAERMACPVVMIGPSGPHEVHMNAAARQMADQLGLIAASDA